MPEKKLVQFNGPALIAAMFRELDPIFRKSLLEKVEKASPILAKTIECLEFHFVDLLRLDDKSLQLMLRTVPQSEWLVAWKLAPKSLCDRLKQNMSERQFQDFEEARKSLPKMHKAQVFKVQMLIAKKAKFLLGEGKLSMRSRRRLQEYQARLKEKVRQLSQQRAVSKKKAM